MKRGLYLPLLLVGVTALSTACEVGREAGVRPIPARPKEPARLVLSVGGSIEILDLDPGGAASAGAGFSTFGRDENPVWQQGSRTIIFSRATDEAPTPIDLFRSTADGRNLEKITSSRGQELTPTVAARRPFTIAFVRALPRGTEIIGTRGDLYVLDMRTGRETRITNSPEPEFSPSLSPDGDKLAFAAVSGKQVELWVATRDDGWTPRRIAGGVEGYSPVWSSSGDRIAFVRRMPRGSDIFVLDVHDESSTRLTTGRSAEEPGWTDDDRFVTFAEPEDPALPSQGTRIYAVPADGGEPEEIAGPFDDLTGYDIHGTLP